MTPARHTPIDAVVLWIAQGFGIGRIPFAPGTFGSMLGFAWFFLLLAFGGPVIYALGSLFGIILSIWSAGRAEKILDQTDPSSVVIDEIVAIPFCFFGLFISHQKTETLYHPAYFQNHLGVLLVIFNLFRLFDILKPWPINRSQKLRGGWGVTIYDLLTAGYV